jgi:tRNA(fMet)-specific endonuclease VapC
VTRCLLDTNICIELLRAGSPAMLARMREHEIDAIAISAITLAELNCGVAKSSRPEHHASLLAQFCAAIGVLPFDHLAAETYGRVRANLERAGTPIGPLDTLIASHALSLGLTVVTNNVREFQRVAGLRVENWLES